MNRAVKRGFSFGLTSGIITTLGLIIGLYSSTYSKSIIIGGIMVIAIADALSDALGIHISEESGNGKIKQIWESTASTFITKLAIALTFTLPILFFGLSIAVIICIIWGLFIISLTSYYIAKQNKMKTFPVITEHLLITILVIIITYYVGDYFGRY